MQGHPTTQSMITHFCNNTSWTNLHSHSIHLNTAQDARIPETESEGHISVQRNKEKWEVGLGLNPPKKHIVCL